MSDLAFYKLGLKVISDQLGPVGMARFIRIRKPGTGDYTAERHKWLDKLDRDKSWKEFSRFNKNIRQHKQRGKNKPNTCKPLRLGKYTSTPAA